MTDSNTENAAPAASRARVLVLGMGNTLVSDDGAGIHAVRRLARLHGHELPHVVVEETPVAGPALIMLLSGYDEAVVVDALLTLDPDPGAIHVLELADLKHTRNTASPHSLNLVTAVELGRRCGLPMPNRIRIVAVEIEDAVNVAEQCTPLVHKSIPKVVDIIRDLCIE